jgi:hypothetical protein
MTKTRWQELLESIKIDTAMGKLKPVRPTALESFEKRRKVKLPRSYRTYCEVFGAGELSEQFKIAVPGYKGATTLYSLEQLDEGARNVEYTVYAKDTEQYERGLFFSVDIARSHHFFDPADVTESRNHEYAVYTVFSDFKVKRTADNFWEFITDSCLGGKHKQLIKGVPAIPVFMPVND